MNSRFGPPRLPYVPSGCWREAKIPHRSFSCPVVCEEKEAIGLGFQKPNMNDETKKQAYACNKIRLFQWIVNSE